MIERRQTSIPAKMQAQAPYMYAQPKRFGATETRFLADNGGRALTMARNLLSAAIHAAQQANTTGDDMLVEDLLIGAILDSGIGRGDLIAVFHILQEARDLIIETSVRRDFYDT